MRTLLDTLELEYHRYLDKMSLHDAARVGIGKLGIGYNYVEHEFCTEHYSEEWLGPIVYVGLGDICGAADSVYRLAPMLARYFRPDLDDESDDATDWFDDVLRSGGDVRTGEGYYDLTVSEVVGSMAMQQLRKTARRDLDTAISEYGALLEHLGDREEADEPAE